MACQIVGPSKRPNVPHSRGVFRYPESDVNSAAGPEIPITQPKLRYPGVPPAGAPNDPVVAARRTDGIDIRGNGRKV